MDGVRDWRPGRTEKRLRRASTCKEQYVCADTMFNARKQANKQTKTPGQSVARSKNPGPMFFNLALNPSYHLTIALIGTNVFSSTIPDPTKLEMKLNRCLTTCSARWPGSAALVATTTAPFQLVLPGSGSVGAIWDKGSIAIPRIAVTSPPTVELIPPANATGPALAPGVKVPRNRKIADGLSFESLPRGWRYYHEENTIKYVERENTHIPNNWNPFPGQ